MFYEATKYNYESGTEDRLTQVVVACFNKSKKVRDAFIEFLIGKKIDGIIVAKTQKQEGNDSRPDIIIYKDYKPYIVIESKTSSIENTFQLENHKKNFNAPFYVLITKYHRNIKLPDKWCKKYWGDFATKIYKECKTAQFEKSKDFDKQICVELMNFFKKTEIMRKEAITREDFKNSMKFLNDIRFKKNPSISIDGISSLNNILDVFDQVLEGIKGDKKFMKEIGLDRKFKSDLRIKTIHYEYHNAEINKLYTNLKRHVPPKQISVLKHIKLAANFITIEKMVNLKGQRKNGITALVLAIRQKTIREKDNIGIEVFNKKNNEYHNCDSWGITKIPENGGLTVEAIQYKVIKYWRESLKDTGIKWE